MVKFHWKDEEDMKIELVNSDTETVVRLSGCLDTAASADFVRAVEAIPTGVKSVRFDCAELEFIASSALRAMVALGKRIAPGGGSVLISGANDVVRDVFEMTGLVEVFTVL